MGTKVCKFGGTSLADTGQMQMVKRIVQDDVDRRFIVPSAPGKREPSDRKITDLLYLCHSTACQKKSFDEPFRLISDRYKQIVNDLGLNLDLQCHLDQICNDIRSGATADYTASRGEYLCGLIMADWLEMPFIDAKEVIHFDSNGQLNIHRTDEAFQNRSKQLKQAVIPGFYGSTPNGKIKTFSRGGSDISGAIVARCVQADVYENWTDVSGLLMADPNIIANPQSIDVLSYRELRELAYMGASVLHDEAIFPVRQAAIPVNIRNTNRPNDPGTMIVPETTPIAHTGTITGIAGRKDFTVIAVEKALMNTEIGFARRLLSILETQNISFEHLPSGIDTMSLVIADTQLNDKLDSLLIEIHHSCHPDSLEVYPDMALVATVGRGMSQTPGMAAKIFTALSSAEVNIRMIDQGSSEINIIVGVHTSDFEKAVRAIYSTFQE